MELSQKDIEKLIEFASDAGRRASFSGYQTEARAFAVIVSRLEDIINLNESSQTIDLEKHKWNNFNRKPELKPNE